MIKKTDYFDVPMRDWYCNVEAHFYGDDEIPQWRYVGEFDMVTAIQEADDSSSGIFDLAEGFLYNWLNKHPDEKKCFDGRFRIQFDYYGKEKLNGED